MRTTKKGPNIVGLDIGTATVAAVELRVNGSVSVEKTAIAPLPEGASQDGEVADADALSATLKDFFTTAKLGKDVRIGVANQRVVVRTLRMPRVEKQGEIENAIRFMAQEQMQMPLDQAYAYTGSAMAENMLLRDTDEGISAFIEKRKPDWA